MISRLTLWQTCCYRILVCVSVCACMFVKHFLKFLYQSEKNSTSDHVYVVHNDWLFIKCYFITSWCDFHLHCMWKNFENHCILPYSLWHHYYDIIINALFTSSYIWHHKKLMLYYSCDPLQCHCVINTLEAYLVAFNACIRI